MLLVTKEKSSTLTLLTETRVMANGSVKSYRQCPLFRITTSFLCGVTGSRSVFGFSVGGFGTLGFSPGFISSVIVNKSERKTMIMTMLPTA